MYVLMPTLSLLMDNIDEKGPEGSIETHLFLRTGPGVLGSVVQDFSTFIDGVSADLSDHISLHILLSLWLICN